MLNTIALQIISFVTHDKPYEKETDRKTKLCCFFYSSLKPWKQEHIYYTPCVSCMSEIKKHIWPGAPFTCEYLNVFVRWSKIYNALNQRLWHEWIVNRMKKKQIGKQSYVASLTGRFIVASDQLTTVSLFHKAVIYVNCEYHTVLIRFIMCYKRNYL
jgi:hypothetical protein